MGVLRTNGIRQADLSLTFVTRQKIQALNRKFLKRTSPTDVLAFDLQNPANCKDGTLIAEVVISVDAARARYREMGTKLYEELGLYIVHGILHLCGYDDHGAKLTQRMRHREQVMCRKFQKHIAKVIS